MKKHDIIEWSHPFKKSGPYCSIADNNKRDGERSQDVSTSNDAPPKPPEKKLKKKK